jgi:hypothetical protein
MAVVSPPTPREAVPDHKIPPGAFEPLVAPRSGYVKDPEAELWLALQANKEEDIQYYGAAVDLKSMVHVRTQTRIANRLCSSSNEILIRRFLPFPIELS